MPAVATEDLARAQGDEVALLDAWEAGDPLEQRESMAELAPGPGPRAEHDPRRPAPSLLRAISRGPRQPSQFLRFLRRQGPRLSAVQEPHDPGTHRVRIRLGIWNCVKHSRWGRPGV